MTATSNHPNSKLGSAPPAAGTARWTEWDNRRLDTLRGAFVAEGWTAVDHGPYVDSYELDLGVEGIAQADVPHDTKSRDTNLLARLAAETLILVSGRPHLEVGPLSEREAAWAQAATTPSDNPVGHAAAMAAPDPAKRGDQPVDELARRQWADVPDVSRYVNERGERKVLGWGERGTTLAPWTGPDPEIGDTRRRLADRAAQAGQSDGAGLSAPTRIPELPNTL
jgi:hypothetical protein